MVCIPCFVVPVLLYVWHKFIQPLFIKYIWNPWAKKDEQGNVIHAAPDFKMECKDGVCALVSKKAPVLEGASKASNGLKEADADKASAGDAVTTADANARLKED